MSDENAVSTVVGQDKLLILPVLRVGHYDLVPHEVINKPWSFLHLPVFIYDFPDSEVDNFEVTSIEQLPLFAFTNRKTVKNPGIICAYHRVCNGDVFHLGAAVSKLGDELCCSNEILERNMDKGSGLVTASCYPDNEVFVSIFPLDSFYQGRRVNRNISLGWFMINGKGRFEFLQMCSESLSLGKQTGLVFIPVPPKVGLPKTGGVVCVDYDLMRFPATIEAINRFLLGRDFVN